MSKEMTLPKQVCPFNDAQAVVDALGELGIQGLDAAKLQEYAVLIAEANKRFNLTAHEDLPSIFSLLFYDALVAYDPLLLAGKKTLLDVGSGSGVPGLLLKMAFKDLAVAIIEANLKKSAFIGETVHSLGLHDIQLLCQRAELITSDQREKFDVVTARALAPLPLLLELLAPYAKVGGYVICPKSRKLKEEMLLAKDAPAQLGLALHKVNSFVSCTGNEHHVAVYKKIAKTDLKFPRKWAQILSKPL